MALLGSFFWLGQNFLPFRRHLFDFLLERVIALRGILQIMVDQVVENAHTVSHGQALSLCGKTGKHCGSHLVAPFIRGVFTTLVLSTSTLSSECKCVHPPSGSVVLCCRGPPVLRSAGPTHLWPLLSVGEPLLTRYFLHLIPHKRQRWLCVNIPVDQQFVKHSCLQLQFRYTVSSHDGLSAAAAIVEPLE